MRTSQIIYPPPPLGSSENSSMISASSYWDPGVASRAFNGQTTGTLWWHLGSSQKYPTSDGNAWLQLDFEDVYLISSFQYVIINRTTPNQQHWRDVVFKTSNSGLFGGEETVIGSYSFPNYYSPGSHSDVVYLVPTPSQFVRIEFHSTWDGYIAAQEVMFY